MKTIAYLAAVFAVIMLVIRSVPRVEAATTYVPVPHRAYDASLCAKEIEFNLARVKRDPGGAIGWRQLASAYLAGAREKDSSELATKAEEAARKSLVLRTKRNAGAAIVLTEALLEQHRFSDALVACKQALQIEPGADMAERTLCDIYFEIGRYDDARNLLGKHAEWTKDPSGITLFARSSELSGNPEEAQLWLQRAADMAESKYEFPASAVSWYHVKLGDLMARYGQLSSAESEYTTALRQSPASWKALASMARLKAMQNDPAGVLTYGKQLLEIAPMTDVVGLMEDASLALGDLRSATQYAANVLKVNQSTIDLGTKEHSGKTPNHTHDRMFSLYLAEHGKMLDLAQHAATHDLAARKDVYAYDAYGWVTFKWAQASGSRPGILEAKQAVDKALSFGIKDPKILRHSKEIDQALKR